MADLRPQLVDRHNGLFELQWDAAICSAVHTRIDQSFEGITNDRVWAVAERSERWAGVAR